MKSKLTDIKKEYEGFDIYLLPKFVKKVTGVDKDGMLFAGMAVNLDELLESTISQTKQELIGEIKEYVTSQISRSDWHTNKAKQSVYNDILTLINYLEKHK